MHDGNTRDHRPVEFHHEPQWEPPRRALGILGIVFAVAGLCIFVIFFALHSRQPAVTSYGMGWAALAVTLVLGGMQGARWGFSAQRAHDTKRAFVGDLAALLGRIDDNAGQIADVRALTAQAVQDGKAVVAVDEHIKELVETGHAQARELAELRALVANQNVEHGRMIEAQGRMSAQMEQMTVRLERAEVARTGMREELAAIREELDRVAAVWQPTDGRWLDDVAQAVQLGKELGPGGSPPEPA